MVPNTQDSNSYSDSKMILIMILWKKKPNKLVHNKISYKALPYTKFSLEGKQAKSYIASMLTDT